MPSSETIYEQVMRGRGVHIDALNHLSYVRSLYTNTQGSSTLRIIQVTQIIFTDKIYFQITCLGLQPSGWYKNKHKIDTISEVGIRTAVLTNLL